LSLKITFLARGFFKNKKQTLQK